MNHFIKTRTHYKIVGIKKERQQVFYLLSALEDVKTVPEIAVRSAILFSGGISPSPSLPISSYLIRILSGKFFKSEKPLIFAENSSYALYFYKLAVTDFQSLPVCYGGTSGFQCYLFMPTLFFLLATLNTVKTPPLTNSSAAHRTILLVSPV